MGIVSHSYIGWVGMEAVAREYEGCSQDGLAT